MVPPSGVMVANPKRAKEGHRGNVQTVITHNVPMQLSRDFLSQVSISDSSGRGWPKNPGLDTKDMRMDRGGDTLEGNVSYDHVHLLLSIPPKMAVSEVVGRNKGRVAIRMYKEVPEIQKKFWGRKFWARGYFVSTVGVDEETIRKYIQNQELKERQTEQQGFEY